MGGVDDVDRLDVGPLGVEDAGVDDRPGGDEAVVDRHDVAGAVPPQTGTTGLVDGELDAGAPAQPVLVARARGRTSTSTSRPAIRANCSRTTAALSARCVSRDACWKSQPPQRPGAAYGHGAVDAAGSGLEHLDGVGAHEAVADASLGDPCDDALTGQRVAHEDDLALVARHAVAAVGHRPDLDGPLPADERLAAGGTLAGRRPLTGPHRARTR